MAGISFSGIASGIDGDAIIKATLDARRLAMVPLQKHVDINTTETSAFEEFSKKLLSVNDIVKDFLTLAGNAIHKSAAVSDSEAVEAVPGSSALAGSTTFTVTQLARSATLSFADTFSAIDQPIAPGLAAPTTLDITIGQGSAATTHSVTISPTTTLAQLVNQINALPDANVRASTVNVGTEASPSYRLVLSTTQSGVEKGSLTVNPSAELSGLGLFQIAGNQPAEDAIIDLEGIGEIRRPTNQIADLIPGVTLTLKQEQTGPITVTIGNDADKTAKKVNDLITALNEVITYANENSTIERVNGEKGPENEFGSLARTRVDNQAVDAIRRALADAKSGIPGSAAQVTADLGITTQRDGTLAFDTEKFLEMVGKDPAGVESILHKFSDAIGSTGGVVNEYTKYQGIIQQAIKANDDEVSRYNERIARLEDALAKQEQSLKLLYANLEKNIAKLNSSGDSLSSLFSGGGGKK